MIGKSSQKEIMKSKFICLNIGCGKLITENERKMHEESCFCNKPLEFSELFLSTGDVQGNRYSFYKLPSKFEQKSTDNYSLLKTNQVSSQISSENDAYGMCQLCNKIISNPLTKHLDFTHFTPPECEKLISKCPNCFSEGVCIKDHYEECSARPLKCHLESLGCTGWIKKHIGICFKYIDHPQLFRDSIKPVIDTLKRYNSENLGSNVDAQMEELENVNRSILKIKETLISHKIIPEPKTLGKLLWRIPNIIEFLNQNEPCLSAPMYTDNQGYKLCLKAYGKGNDIGKDEYVAIFFVLMKGQYDDFLSWPFPYNVKITLYNKQSSLSVSESYKLNRKMSNYQKPNSDFNIATGNPKFIALEHLQNGGFIIDDSIYIELAVIM